MSYQYPVLDNRRIDQWKVTELKEELKRRKLTTKGLKDDLIKRLDEALRVERENAAAEEEKNNRLDEALRIEREKAAAEEEKNSFNLDPQPEVEERNATAVPVVTEAVNNLVDDATNKDEVATVHFDINNSIEPEVQDFQEGIIVGGINSSKVVGELIVEETTVETSATITESVVTEMAASVQDVQFSGTQEVNGILKSQLENEDSKAPLESEDSKAQMGSEDSKPQLDDGDLKSQLENVGLKPSHQDVMLDSSAPNNQVSEVNPNLGLQVKSDSISTDSVSINEKIELKDNIIADDVKLELDVVKSEMVEPSSSNVVPVGGKSHPMDVEEPLEKKAAVEDKDDSGAAITNMSKKNDIVDAGYSEKLNLDRSSGDDSMEEDVIESKQIDSKYNSDEVGDGSDKSEVPVVKEEKLVAILGYESSTDHKEIPAEHKIHTTVPSDKRKLNDEEPIVNTEPSKRQRRWNSQSIKVPEPQSSNLTLSSTPKDSMQLMPLKRNFSRSDSSVSEDTPKERTVPPSQKPPTNSLRIDRFLRPFTLKAVQELLGKTGTVISFWMDHIKTHCYVTYSSVEEAVGTRNAVYNLQWPPNGGRLLVAEFVDPQEVKVRMEAPPQSPATPITPSAPAPPTPTVQRSPNQQVSRQQLPPPLSLPPPPPLSNPPLVKERLAHPAPPPPPETHDPPIVTLDDLFRKTKSTPRIYYLPLSEEQAAAKLAERGKNTKQ